MSSEYLMKTKKCKVVLNCWNVKMRLIAICILMSMLGHNAMADTISLAADEWCPYNCQPNSKNPGFMVEIAQRTLGAEGHAVVYKVMPWSRAIKSASEGKINAVIAAVREKEAEDFVFPAHEQGVNTTGVWVRDKDPWVYAGLESFKGRKIGIISDYHYVEFTPYFNNNSTDPIVEKTFGENAFEQNINKLLKGRINTFVSSKAVTRYYLHQHQLTDQIKLVGLSVPTPLYIAFNPTNPKSQEYARIISDGTEVLRASGELAKILAKYGLHDWDKIKRPEDF